MATSAQVLHCPPGAHAARRHFGNALHSQAVRQSLKSGAGRAFQPQPRGTSVISAAGDSGRQSVEDRKVLFNAAIAILLTQLAFPWMMRSLLYRIMYLRSYLPHLQAAQASSAEASSSEGFSGLVNNLLFGVRFVAFRAVFALACSIAYIWGCHGQLSHLKGVVSVLAHRVASNHCEQDLVLAQAASSLERGDATCAKCRGAGALSCPSCKVRTTPPSCGQGLARNMCPIWG